MSNCVICDIVTGNIASWVVFEDANVIAFLPLVMDTYGHTVIAPKAHFADLLVSPDAVITQVMTCAKELAHRYRASIGASGFNLLHASGLSAQQSVLHLHVHLLPRYDDDGLNAWPTFPAKQHNKAEIIECLCSKG